MDEATIERARRAALDQAEKDERLAGLLTYAAGGIEAAVLVAILFVIDWSNDTHLLVFLCACLVYAPLAFGLLALRIVCGAYGLGVLRSRLTDLRPTV